MRGPQMSNEMFTERWRALPVSTDLFGVVDSNKMERRQFCREVAEGLEKYGIVFLATPEGDADLSDRMMREMGRFFMSPEEVQRQTITQNFQGGLTPEGEEAPDVDEQEAHFRRLTPANYPFPTPFGKDPKKRFMCKVGDAPAMTRFPGLTPPTQIISGHEALYALCAQWGLRKLIRAQMLLDAYAEHYSLPPGSFPTRHGAHFVAPTGIDFTRHVPGTVAADVHGDMGFITGHDASKVVFGDTLELRPCGGLVAWDSAGRLFRAVVPKGAEPWQAGFQLREMTGGKILAGMHQVIAPPESAAFADEARTRSTSVYRVTATLFVHGTADERAIVHPCFREPGREYAEPYLGELDQRVLDKIFAQNKTDGVAKLPPAAPTSSPNTSGSSFYAPGV